jgi:hypothetical protein
MISNRDSLVVLIAAIVFACGDDTTDVAFESAENFLKAAEDRYGKFTTEDE